MRITSSIKTLKKTFEFFRKRVLDWGERVEWLKKSVHNGADTLITACESNEEGYTKCFELLDKKYKNTDLIREGIFDFIDKLNFPSMGKAHVNLSDKIVALYNYLEELEKVHGQKMNHYYLAHLLLKRIPANVRKEFSDTCNKLYPNVLEIFEKYEEVITKLNYASGETPTYPVKSTKKESGPNQTKTVHNITTPGKTQNKSKPTSKRGPQTSSSKSGITIRKSYKRPL